jgi:hypothetical protein
MRLADDFDLLHLREMNVVGHAAPRISLRLLFAIT